MLLPMDATLSDANRQAWDTLYRQTEALVWGDRPIGFLEEFAPYLAPYRKRGARLLDAAAGEGRNLACLLSLQAQVHACDASAHALAKIPADVRRQVLTSVCDLSRLPFDDGYFDGVLATDVIETLPDPGPALREIRRALRPGGRLLCNIPGFDDEIAGVEMTPIGVNRFLFRGRFFYQFLTEHEALELLIGHGFEILKKETRRWMEEPHPAFRGTRHQHTSRVFLVEKPELSLADLGPAEIVEARW